MIVWKWFFRSSWHFHRWGPEKLFKGELVLLQKFPLELLKMREATAAKSSNFLQNFAKCQWVHCHWSLRFCSQKWLSAWGSTSQDSFPRIILSLWHLARFFRRLGCWGGLAAPGSAAVSAEQHERDTAAQLNRPLTSGDDGNIPIHSLFFLLILLPFSPFPSSSVFYGIFMFSFCLALIQLQWMKFILNVNFPMKSCFRVPVANLPSAETPTDSVE